MRRSFVIGFVIASLLIGFFVWLTFHNLQRAERDSMREEGIMHTLNAAENLMDDIREMESGQREYFISGDLKYLARYERALGRIPKDSNTLKNQAETEDERVLVAELLNLTNRKIRSIQQGLRTYERSGHVVPSELETEQARKLMDDIRLQVRKLEDYSKSLIKKYSDEERSTARRTTIIAVILAIAFLLFLLIAFLMERGYLLRRYHKDLAREVDKGIFDFKDILDRIDDGFVAFDKDWKYVYVNNKALEILGKNPEELIGHKVSDFFSNEKTGEVHDAFQTAMKTQQYVFHEEYQAAKDRWIENHIYPSERGLSVYFKDVSEKRRVENSLQLANEQYKTLVEQATDGIFIADQTGKFVVVNSSGCTMSQYSRDELKRMTIFDLADPQDLAENPFHFEEMKTPTGARVERKMKKKDGSIIDIEVNAKFLSDGRFLAFIRDITQRKKAESEIRKANERFELIARTANEALWEMDFETGYAWGNERHQYLYGLTLKDPIPGHDEWVNRIHRDDRERITGSFKKLLSSNENVWLSEYRFLMPDGNMATIYDRTYVLRDDNGKPLRMMGSMVDISDRVKAEQEISKAKDMAEKLIDSLPGVFYFYDDAGKFIRWNKQFEEVTGYSSEEIAGMHPIDFFAEEDREYIAERIKGVFELGINDAEAPFKAKDGKKTLYYFKAILIHYDGKPCLLGNGIDISERKKTEEVLRISERNYRSLVEQAADAIFIFNGEGEFVDLNSVSLELTGYTKEELLKMHIWDILFPEDLETNPIMFDPLNKGESVINRRNFRRKDGSSVPVEVHSKKLPDGRFLGMVRDLTERIESERQLEESFRAIRELTEHIQNIREEERSHIAREIHDELGQQLTVLKMDVSWLNKKLGGVDKAITVKLENLTSMLDGTVRTVRRISSELRPSLLDDLGLVPAIEWQLREFEKHSGLEIEFIEPEEEIAIPESIKTGLFRIVQESLTNVARHADASKVKVRLQQKGDMFILSIEDDGKGFNKIQTDNKRTLGILGMQERTAMMGGTYHIEGKPGKGTIVLVTVPLKNKLQES